MFRGLLSDVFVKPLFELKSTSSLDNKTSSCILAKCISYLSAAMSAETKRKIVLYWEGSSVDAHSWSVLVCKTGRGLRFGSTERRRTTEAAHCVRQSRRTDGARYDRSGKIVPSRVRAHLRAIYRKRGIGNRGSSREGDE